MIMMQKMFTQTQNVAILNVAINFIGVLNHISLFDNKKKVSYFLAKKFKFRS